MALYELQKIDSKIDEINKVKGELPLEVQDLEDEMAGMKTRIEQHQRRDRGAEHARPSSASARWTRPRFMIGNYKEQQNNVRNNREFDAITKEIEYQELEIELAEKRLKEYTAGVKAKKLQLEEAESRLRRSAPPTSRPRRAELEGIEAETAPLVAEYAVQADARQGEDRRAPAGGLRAASASNVRNGLAVVTVKRDACGGCFNRIPPAASGGHPPGQEDHYLRVLRTYSRDRSRRGSGVADHSVNKRAGVIQLRPSSFSRAATTRPRRRESPRRRRRTMRTNRLCTGRRS